MEIVVEGVAKRYGKVQALAGVDLDVPQGSILGLVGPKGAGQTTLIRIPAPGGTAGAQVAVSRRMKLRFGRGKEKLFQVLPSSGDQSRLLSLVRASNNAWVPFCPPPWDWRAT